MMKLYIKFAPKFKIMSFESDEKIIKTKLKKGNEITYQILESPPYPIKICTILNPYQRKKAENFEK